MDLSARSSLLDLQNWDSFSISTANITPRRSKNKLPKNLSAENKELRIRLEEAKETLHAIRNGEVDALIVSGANGEQIVTLKQAEEQLRHQALILGKVNDAILAYDAQYRLTVWNAAAESLYGWKADEVLGRNVMDLLNTQWPVGNSEKSRRTIGELQSWRGEVTQERRDGTRIPIEMSSMAISDEDGTTTGYVSVNRDITERKQSEAKLHQTEEFASLFMKGVRDYAVFMLDPNGYVMSWNAGAEQIEGYHTEEILGEHFSRFYPASDLKINKPDQELDIARKTGQFQEEGWRVHKDGTKFMADVTLTALYDDFGELRGFAKSIREITERRQAEEKLRESEQQYRRIIETAREGVWTLDTTERTTLVNQRLADMLGYTIEEMMGRSIYDFLDDEGKALTEKSLANRRIGISEQLDFKFIRKDGSVLWALMETSPLLDKEHTYLGALAMVTDITHRRLAADAVQQAKDFAEDIIQTANVIFLHLDISGTILNFNAAAELITGYGRSEVLGRKWAELMGPNVNRPSGSEGLDQLVYKGKGPLNLGKTIRTKLGEERNILWNHNVLHEAGKVTGIISFGIDITEQKRGETRIQRQLEHLTSLSAIDQVISSNFNLEISLSQILNHVTTQLGVDAADILIFDTSMEILEFAAEHGFRTQAIKKTQLRLGKGIASRVVLERHLIQLPYSTDDAEILSHSAHLAGEDFVIYFGVPLISKGQVKGVLEVYNRAALKPDEEWFDFLNTLAGQTAIAIENATLFKGLQLSNTELSMAYDATIEGWSRALDLRDKETEGHTQRVTDKTVRLARAFGLNEKELVQVRWGALLHDIGKLGIPDGILLKAGPLTDAEWILMKKHPTFASEMLSPIRFLRHALDIPYCHHEKWDGTGYPRGLKGDQIPVVARIFAVVDVWDALSSDRPYRKAWPEEKIREHIRSLSGTHFEPHIVDVVMGIYNETTPLFATDGE